MIFQLMHSTRVGNDIQQSDLNPLINMIPEPHKLFKKHHPIIGKVSLSQPLNNLWFTSLDHILISRFIIVHSQMMSIHLLAFMKTCEKHLPQKNEVLCSSFVY